MIDKDHVFDPRHILEVINDMIKEKEIFPLNMLSLTSNDVDIIIANFKHSEYYLEKTYEPKINQYILHVRNRL